MLFNSYTFIIFFLPLAYAGLFISQKWKDGKYSIVWLVTCSLFFYGWWNFFFVALILFSIAFNYYLGGLIQENFSKLYLKIGILGNLLLISYFKYFNFFIENLNVFVQLEATFEVVILPLAISFFTFQQIAYLIDIYRKKTSKYKFSHYCLFVTFFPQLLAGPIVHHKEMIPQFRNNLISNLTLQNLIIGISIFSIGLFKKVIIADNVESYATPLFTAAENGEVITFVEAWLGALSYSFQIYFDFSGYCDMAIGIARMFGVFLPLNFDSPYKSNNIIDFWRKWHITLSRFLKEYLYFSLGGNRKGKLRKYLNLLITMLLGGLWHGAGWTFISWGFLHGIYLIINHLWRNIRLTFIPSNKKILYFSVLSSRILTMVSIVFAWVLFRSDSFSGALNIYKGLFAYNGISLPEHYYYRLGSISEYLLEMGISFSGLKYFYGTQQIFVILSLIIMVSFMPNTQEIFSRYKPALGYIGDRKETFFFSLERPKLWAFISALVFMLSVLSINQVNEFIYFQF